MHSVTVHCSSFTNYKENQSGGMRRVTGQDRSPCNVEQNSGHTNTSCGRRKGQIHSTRPSKSTHAEKFVGRQDRPSNPHRVLSLWWCNHLDHIVSGDESVSFFVMRSPISWNMVVRLEVQLRHCVFCMGPL